MKWLAGKWLKKEIQTPTNSGGVQTVGHNSEEDARAAIELVKLKIEKGPTFGEFAADQESIFERLARADPKKRTCIVDHGDPGHWHGAKANTAIACNTDEEVGVIRQLSKKTLIPVGKVIKGVVDNLQRHDFVFARLMDLSHALGCESSLPIRSLLFSIEPRAYRVSAIECNPPHNKDS